MRCTQYCRCYQIQQARILMRCTKRKARLYRLWNFPNAPLTTSLISSDVIRAAHPAVLTTE